MLSAESWRSSGKSSKKEQRLQVMDTAVAKTDRTGWFKRTGWLEHLAGCHLAHLAHQTRLPNRSEVKLQLAAELVEKLVERSVQGLLTLDRESRRWLRSARQEDPDTRPFARLQNPESQARYAGYMVRFVCYFLRIVVDGVAQEEKDRDSDWSSVYPSSTMHSLRSGRPCRLGRTEDAAISNSSSCPQRRNKVDNMKDAHKLFSWQGSQRLWATQLWDALDGNDEDAQMQALLDALTSFFFASTQGRPFSSGLVHFLAVLGIDVEMNRLRTAKKYSYMLAGIVYCMRVLSVEKLLPSAYRDKQTDADRNKFLQTRKQYLADGSYSTMSEAINMLAYGKHVALEAGNAGNTYWSKDKSVFYLRGQLIHISSFRKMAQDVVAEVEQMLWQELCWVSRKDDWFAVKLGQIVDDVSFTMHRYSFINRQENGLASGLQWMLTQAKQTEQGRALYASNGRWDVKQIKQYLRCVDRFLALLLSQWDKPKVVPRFLPPQLGQVMVVYLAYVRPFREYLMVKVLGGNFSDYVWVDEHGPWDTDRLTRALKRETGKRLGVELNTLDYRHKSVGIGREKVGQSFGKGYQDEVGEVEEAEVDEDLIELQNARTTSMGVGNYSVPIDIVKHLSARSIEAFRVLSDAWHRFLGLDRSGAEQQEMQTAGASTDEARQGRKRREGSHDEEHQGVKGEPRALMQQQKPFRVSNVKETAIHRAMRQVLGQEDVGFRSMEQEQALHAVLDRHTPLVVVLPTGGGKSLLFMVPACLVDAGVTVVVVPYQALIEDLVSRVQRCGIDCIEWRHGKTNPASVVVVSADVAGDTDSNGNFLGYARMLDSKGLLRWVVVDECHLTFTSSHWRPKLAALKNLRSLPCPIVLLMATLLPARQGELEASMLLPCAEYVRASTVRPNTCYYVLWCRRGEKKEMALMMCRQQQQQLREKGLKGVVYCHSKAVCEQMAEMLECTHYHAGMPDRAERLEQWLKNGGLVIATSALGTGVDFPGIVFILHVGMPWSMIDYVQESGRGGRAGKRVDSVVLLEPDEVEQTMQQKSTDVDVQAMGNFLIGSGCRRRLMSTYMDIKAMGCDDIVSAGCDWCGEGARGWQDAQQETSAEWEQVEKLFSELRDGCVSCCMLDDAGRDEWRRHKTLKCTAHPGVMGVELDRFRVWIRDQGGSHSCRWCWVSQKYCATRESVENRCQWPNVVVLKCQKLGLG
ncbi:P-loop containing nucleoside triphosphate hydrolase protein [Macroventuria anomochaeta]|uniref:P-loop containing nucleoside triphosphate hydrolase protein n=1 Tax=Macroventuria anomochaeta TaxID=301207 RepID=A0ACB6RR58_9PLEO|nr:P-loop containing nucleoside triphosphate hydrolase protein [Macroventuria anomochaeta]KAF2624455.1 P-loop containing nucleoside triphosphate hydrolase protein [Macroventuria anomochaeta]